MKLVIGVVAIMASHDAVADKVVHRPNETADMVVPGPRLGTGVTAIEEFVVGGSGTNQTLRADLVFVPEHGAPIYFELGSWQQRADTAVDWSIEGQLPSTLLVKRAAYHDEQLRAFVLRGNVWDSTTIASAHQIAVHVDGAVASVEPCTYEHPDATTTDGLGACKPGRTVHVSVAAGKLVIK